MLCPPGEPPSHTALSICLHQISAMAGLHKPAINAIRSVAFLLDEMEDTQINETVKEALDSQMTEFTSDFKLLIEDAKEKINEHLKISEDHIIKAPTPPLPSQHDQSIPTYASVLINPPAHANPKVAAREGIRARQFMLDGIKSSKFSHLDTSQLKTELNKILLDLGLQTGKIRTLTNARTGGTIAEMDTDTSAAWLSDSNNQRKLCDRIGSNAEFRTRAFNVIAFNVPLTINPDQESHRQEICEANDYEQGTITATKWAKAIEKRNPNQRTAHLFLTFSNADAANRSITNGIYICNRRCHVEKTKREPTRCLKCQGWNHVAKECLEVEDKCGNCAGEHRTSNCLTTEQKCVSCNTSDHASWSRSCPTFLKKSDEFNIRNPDNLLQYFPTADPWTWSTIDKSPPPHQQTRKNNGQSEKRPPQPPSKRADTYTPTYDGYFTRSDQTTQIAENSNLGHNTSTPPNRPRQQNGPNHQHADTHNRTADPPPVTNA